MNLLGVVAEYNPFHNGHKYHIECSKALCKADAVICVMSGNYIQRGEPAIVDKWARTEMALLCGVDLVIELPLAYAMSSAEFFAYGAVKILDSIGLVDSICFGSEAGSIELLEEIAEVLYSEPLEYKSLLRNSLSDGLSFPTARENALIQYLKNKSLQYADVDTVISKSNNILGIEYLKALKKLNSVIKPYTIRRTGNDYNSDRLEGYISSATSIRKHVMSSSEYDVLNTFSKLETLLPSQCNEILKREFQNGRGPVFSYDFEEIILSRLRDMDAAEIARYTNVGEGLENRIKNAAEISGSLEELIDNINTRRYTVTRIQRCLFSIFTGLKSQEFIEFNKYGGPQYIRVLGFNKTGRQLLSQINKKCILPVIIKTADFKNSCNPLLSRMLQLESASTDQYVLSYRNKAMRKAGQEYTRNVIRHL